MQNGSGRRVCSSFICTYIYETIQPVVYHDFKTDLARYWESPAFYVLVEFLSCTKLKFERVSLGAKTKNLMVPNAAESDKANLLLLSLTD